MKENKIRTKLLIFINLEIKNNIKKNKDFLINSIKVENYTKYYENYIIFENNLIHHSQKNVLSTFALNNLLKNNINNSFVDSPKMSISTKKCKKIIISKNKNENENNNHIKSSFYNNFNIFDSNYIKHKHLKFLSFYIKKLRKFCFTLKKKEMENLQRNLSDNIFNKKIKIKKRKTYDDKNSKKCKNLLKMYEINEKENNNKNINFNNENYNNNNKINELNNNNKIIQLKCNFDNNFSNSNNNNNKTIYKHFVFNNIKTKNENNFNNENNSNKINEFNNVIKLHKMWTSSKKSKKKSNINNDNNSFMNEKNLFSMKIQKDKKNKNDIDNNINDNNNSIYSNINKLNFYSTNDSTIKCKLILSSRVVKPNYNL